MEKLLLSDIRAHRLIDRVNELERRHADAVRLGNTTIAAKLQRRIKVIDRQAWNMSSDDSQQCDNCGTSQGHINRAGLCVLCAHTVEEQHG
jgi:ribosomal protein S14